KDVPDHPILGDCVARVAADYDRLCAASKHNDTSPLMAIPRSAEDLRSFPVSSRTHYPEGFIIFDDVFVPNDRVIRDGASAHAAVFAHALGLWERLGGLSGMADEADLLVGLAQLIAEANGLAGVGHIKE